MAGGHRGTSWITAMSDIIKPASLKPLLESRYFPHTRNGFIYSSVHDIASLGRPGGDRS
jgi:hypothetical protein